MKKPKLEVFKDTSRPGWWIKLGAASYPYLLLMAGGIWWRCVGFAPTAETLIVESDKAELDHYFGMSGILYNASMRFGQATRSQQEVWVHANPADPHAQCRVDAALRESEVVNEVHAMITAYLQKTTYIPSADFSFYQRFLPPIRPRTHPEWKTMAALLREPPVIA
jgi:hypothetical protein